MSKNKRRRRPLKTNKNDLVHEEMFDDKPAKVGCTCQQDGRSHGGGWIQCTENDCTVWHCIDDITDNYVLLDDEIDDLQDSNNTFKCILHGFYRMKIGNKALYQSEDSESNDKHEETYNPPTNTNTNSIKQKRKRKTETQTNGNNKSDINTPPAHKKRKIDLSLIPPLEPMNQSKITYSNAELANPHIIHGKNIYQINKNQLKQLCRKLGLKVTGTKSELIDSLLLRPKESDVKMVVNNDNSMENNNDTETDERVVESDQHMTENDKNNNNGMENSNNEIETDENKAKADECMIENDKNNKSMENSNIKMETDENKTKTDECMIENENGIENGIEVNNSEKKTDECVVETDGHVNEINVNKILSEAGVNVINNVNICLKKGIEIGYIKIDMNGKGLDEIICNGKCELCNKIFNASIRDCLYQKINGGDDYENGSIGGVVQHECDGFNGNKKGMYVTDICKGKARFDNGKEHNHCNMCDGFGKCIGNCKMRHCKKCNEHYEGDECVCENKEGKKEENKQENSDLISEVNDS